MTLQEITPTILIVGYVIVEIINAVRGNVPITVLLMREFRLILLEVLREIGEGNWKQKLNSFMCVVFGIGLLFSLASSLHKVFTNYSQLMIGLIFFLFFSIALHITYRTSISFITGYR